MDKMSKSEVIGFLAKQWQSSGVSDGDLLLVHSSAKRTLRTIKKMNSDCGAPEIVESFIKAVGNTGTVFFPTFNFEFNKGAEFDINRTPSHMGVISESARNHHEAIRSGHPVYSFVGIGHDSHHLKGLENYSGYGEDSPFSILHNRGGKIAVLDLPDQDSMTFYHYVEETLRVEYRHFKEFTSSYRDVKGKVGERTFAIYVRDLGKGVQTHVNPMGEILWEKGLYSGDRPEQNSGLRMINATAVYDEVSWVIKHGKAEGLLFKIEG